MNFQQSALSGLFLLFPSFILLFPSCLDIWSMQWLTSKAILPFCPDFVTIDQLKDAICDSIYHYSSATLSHSQCQTVKSYVLNVNYTNLPIILFMIIINHTIGFLFCCRRIMSRILSSNTTPLSQRGVGLG